MLGLPFLMSLVTKLGRYNASLITPPSNIDEVRLYKALNRHPD